MSTLRIALVGNPNCGKTALFNLLTGSRQKVANYAGVTVERKSGRLVTPSGRTMEVLDLPGAYSLAAASPDEEITRDVCLGRFSGEQRPDAIVCVADATNLRLHLRFVLELRRLGLPMILALNMSDSAQKRDVRINRERLEKELGIPVVETVAVHRGGAAALVSQFDRDLPEPAPALPDGMDLHAEVNRILSTAVTMPSRTAKLDDAIDRVVLHRVWGLVILALVMFFMFQAVFAWAAPFMEAIDAGVGAFGGFVGDALPDGPLRGLLVEGIIAGVGSVIIFLPQILFLFLFILILEESGYLPRAAFLLDRMMVGAGLTGRSFIPLLSSVACAIPGIMAARTIQDPRDRLATILVAPLMTCSARLPVYTLLIAAFHTATNGTGRVQPWRCRDVRAVHSGDFFCARRCLCDEAVSPEQRGSCIVARVAILPSSKSTRHCDRAMGPRQDIHQARRQDHSVNHSYFVGAVHVSDATSGLGRTGN